jgi:hypothetical protein
MQLRLSQHLLSRLVWVLSLIAIPCWIAVDQPVAWDFSVIQQAMHSLRNGHDPYLDGIDAQEAYLHSSAALRGDPRPYVYVYTPVTLLLLRPFARAPEMVVELSYWTIYMLLILAQLVIAKRLARPQEKYAADLFMPLPLFFPGLLLYDSVLGGNVAFILFGLILLACWRGWTRERWLAFYAAVLLASCFKPTYLTLLAIPLLSGRRQWIPASVAATAGIGLFAVQPYLWPVSFHNYLLAIDRIFSFNNDFGSGPAGRLGASLAALHLPYTLPSVLVYLAGSLLVLFFLFRFAASYRAGLLSREQWIPLMMLGVLLLNPRLIEYEIFPSTFFMAFVAYRLIASSARPRLVATLLFPVWIGANYFANGSRTFWKCCECVFLLVLFVGGCWQIQRSLRHRDAQNALFNTAG